MGNQNKGEGVPMKKFLMIAGLAMVAVVGLTANATYAGDQKISSLKAITQEFQAVGGEQKQLDLNLQQAVNETALGSLKTFQGQINVLRTIASAKDPKAAERLQKYAGVSENLVLLNVQWSGMPEHYGSEVAPIVFGYLKQAKSPQKPTQRQAKLIAAGQKSGFNGIADEVTEMIKQDSAVMQKKIASVRNVVDTSKIGLIKSQR